MAFEDSTSPDITESLPARLSGRELAQALQNFALTADVTIANLPFRLAISNERPYRRASAPIRKQQFDASQDAGEQTLDQWWLRSQTSWHRGAGIRFYEPGTDPGTEHRFDSSGGVDVWTIGEATCLRSLESVATGVGDWFVLAAHLGGLPRLVVVNATTVTVYEQDATTVVNTITTSSAVVEEPVIAGETIYLAHAFGIRKANLLTDATVTAVYNQALATSPRVHYLKDRLIVTRGANIYELAPDGSTSAGDLDTATANYTANMPGWTWTGAAEAPGAIMVAGYAPGTGAIFRLPLSVDGSGLPVLGPAEQVAEFPPGEEVHSIKVYLGQYIAIGTNEGVRIGLLGQDGQLSYGPVVVESDVAVTALAAYDRFFYAALEDSVARIDVSSEVEDGSLRFAWANDVATSGKAQSIAILKGGVVAVGIQETGALLQGDGYETGSLTTGAIRFGTTEPKQFHYVRLRTRIDAGHGSVNLSVVTRSGDTISIITVTDSTDLEGDIRISYPASPQEYMAFRVTLTPGPSGPPVLESLAVKAVPMPSKRQRLIEVPLWCVDKEQDRFGNTYHGHGFARLAALEDLERESGVVQFRDTTTDEALSVVIEEVRFDRITPPMKADPNFGGVVTLVLRAV